MRMVNIMILIVKVIIDSNRNFDKKHLKDGLHICRSQGDGGVENHDGDLDRDEIDDHGDNDDDIDDHGDSDDDIDDYGDNNDDIEDHGDNEHLKDGLHVQVSGAVHSPLIQPREHHGAQIWKVLMTSK